MRTFISLDVTAYLAISVSQYLTHNKTEEITSTINKHIQKVRTSTEVHRPAQVYNSSVLYTINNI
jgi:hypothetical protein